MNFKVIEGWGRLPDGWHFVEVAGVAVDAKDNVFCFTRASIPSSSSIAMVSSCARGARDRCAAPTASPSTPTAWYG
jgi:hypothetical protein